MLPNFYQNLSIFVSSDSAPTTFFFLLKLFLLLLVLVLLVLVLVLLVLVLLQFCEIFRVFTSIDDFVLKVLKLTHNCSMLRVICTLERSSTVRTAEHLFGHVQKKEEAVLFSELRRDIEDVKLAAVHPQGSEAKEAATLPVGDAVMRLMRYLCSSRGAIGST